MSTNYYARIIPTKECKDEIKKAINTNDFHLIKKLVEEAYGRLTMSYEDSDLIGGEVHLGKRAGGWKFLWDPNVFVVRHGHAEKDSTGSHYKWIEEPSTPLYLYPLTKKGLHDFIFRKDVLVYDEYDELQDKEEFWQMALEWGYDKDNEGWDAVSYEAYERKQNNYYREYPITGELTDFLKSEGYEFTSCTNSDFYSDGLRFAGYTDFS